MSVTTHAVRYPGMSAIFKGADVPIDPQQKELFIKQLDFTSMKEEALVQSFSLLKTKANKICLWILFKTAEPETVKNYFEKHGIKLVLSPLHSNQYMTQIIFKMNQIAAIYRIIKTHNQFMDNSERPLEKELRALARL